MPEVIASEYTTSKVIFAGDRFGGSKPPGPPLQPPGGGGTYDGMEARVARLESDVGHIQRDVAELKSATNSIRTDVSKIQIDFAETKAHITYLPSKTFIVSVVIAGVAFTATILTLLSRFGWLVAGAPK